MAEVHRVDVRADVPEVTAEAVLRCDAAPMTRRCSGENAVAQAVAASGFGALGGRP